jgi:heptosyltransferase I
LSSPSADLRHRDFRKILLIKLSAVGDVIHTIPLLNKLRRRYPAARLDWLVTPAIGELLRHHPAITNVIAFTRQNGAAQGQPPAMIAHARLAAALRKTGYDLVIDMHGQARTALLTIASGAPVRIGFDRPRASVWEASPRHFPPEARRHAWRGAREGSWLVYTHHIPVPTLDLHAVDRYLSIGPLLGLDEGPADFSFPIPRAATERIASLLDKLGGNVDNLAVLAPGTIWETKQWRSECFAEVARHLLENGFAVALIGAQRERAACEAVARLAPGSINLAGTTTLSELAAVIGRSAISITNDSGPMHLAVALGRPVVSIFGPTDPLWIGPYRRPGSVLQAALACSPCYLRRLDRCRHDHLCMREVTAQAVIERVASVLGITPGRVGSSRTRVKANGG